MNLSKSKITIFNQQVTRYDKLLITLLCILTLCSMVMLTINALFFHFTFGSLSPTGNYTFFVKMPLLIGLMATAFYLRKTHPQLSFFVYSISIYFLAMLPFVLYKEGAVTTPFQPIDHYLAYVDGLLGFHLPKLVAFTHAHPTLHSILVFAYDSDLYQMALIPIFLFIADNRQGFAKLLVIGIASYFIMCTIYYFFPTNGPVSVYGHYPFFPSNQYYIAERFAQVHAGLPITAPFGGMIAFPSGHVICGLLFLVSTFRTKWLFYPLLVLNTLLISSTLLLGWHYLVDVMTSFAIVFTLNWAYNALFNKWLLTDPATYTLFFAKSKLNFKQKLNYMNPWAPITQVKQT